MNTHEKKSSSFNIDSILKITTFSTLIGIGVLLFTQHLIFSSSIDKMKLKRQIFHGHLNLTGEDTFLTKDFSEGQPFTGYLFNEVKVSSAIMRPDPDYSKAVFIKLDGNQNITGISDSSKCGVIGLAYASPSNLDTVNISLQQLRCTINDVEEYYDIEGSIGDEIGTMGIKAEKILANLIFKNEKGAPVLLLQHNMRVKGSFLRKVNK